MANTIEPDALLTRREAAAALSELGFKTSPGALATAASRGDGPPFRKYGRKIVVYRWHDVLAWAESRLSEVYNNTSEMHARRAA